jgi:hypothetical protein
MKRLTFEQRNKLKLELYSGVDKKRKAEILFLLKEDEKISFVLDSKGELGDEGF